MNRDPLVFVRVWRIQAAAFAAQGSVAAARVVRSYRPALTEGEAINRAWEDANA